MSTAYNTACLVTKLAFIVALIGFVILAGVLFMLSGFLNPGEGQDLFLSMLCGGIYIIGSIIIIGDRFSIPVMVASGIILNLIGAFCWSPAIGSNEAYFAMIGIVLTSLWVLCVALRITTANKTAHTNPLPRSESKPE